MTARILIGDCRDVLKTLADGSVNCCVTSPPYFGLRDYGTAAWVGGWNPGCEHKKSVWEGPKQTQGAQSGHSAKKDKLGRKECIECGAVRIDSQIGLEPTPDEFVVALVDVFREVRRVLRDDGTVWLNLGDSYAGSWGAQSRGGAPSESSTLAGNGHFGGGPKLKGLSSVQIKAVPKLTQTGSIRQLGLKPKDLIGIPWRVAFALQADGWYLRQDIIWHKPNPMPESVTDRCTKSHEYLFLLSKSERYYFDADAVSENAIADHGPGNRTHKGETAYNSGDEKHRTKVGLVAYSERQRRSRGTPPRHAQYESSDQSGLDDVGRGGTRNKRSVWTVATQPFTEAHFATFPPKLIEPCILAGCPVGGTVLDPFGGAGTTGLVAEDLGRNSILIELNHEYAAIADNRIRTALGRVEGKPLPRADLPEMLRIMEAAE